MTTQQPEAPRDLQGLLDILATLEDDEARAGYIELLPADQLAVFYLGLRDVKKQIEDHAKKLAEPMTTGMELIQQKFLADMNQSGETTKSGNGWRATKSIKTNCTMPDPQAFYAFLEQTGRYDMLQKRLSSSVVLDYQSENSGALPPGVNANQFNTVTFYTKRG